MLTQVEINKRQKRYRKENGNAYTKKYEKTINGFLVRMYRNMQSRTLGIQKQKKHLYGGKELFNKEEFYTWAKTNTVFAKLFKEWEDAGYTRKLCPTVDRVDSTKGYSFDNVVWLTHSENSRKGCFSRWQKS